MTASTPTGTQVGVLHSVQVGTPHHYGEARAARPIERAMETSFVRPPSGAARWLYTTHLDGNEQADKINHGKLGQAVLLYAAAHYPAWRAELGDERLGPGGFAENFTIDGLSEADVCIGDVYGIGEARIVVTGPRYPCTKIERRWQIDGLTARVAATGRTGWYCAVRQEGLIEPGAPIVLIERPYPRWTIALVNDFGHGRNGDLALARELAACPALVDFWQELVVRMAERGAAAR